MVRRIAIVLMLIAFGVLCLGLGFVFMRVNPWSRGGASAIVGGFAFFFAAYMTALGKGVFAKKARGEKRPSN